MSRHLSMILPGLLDKNSTQADFYLDDVRQGGVELDGLEWFLTLAECALEPELDVYALLWRLAGMNTQVPVAALSYLHDYGQLPPGPVLRADPVYMEADRDCVRLLDANLKDISPDHAQQLVVEINQQFKDEPWRLILSKAQRWYLLLDRDADIRTFSPQQALGDDIHDYMPVGKQQDYWRSIINEIQMLLFSSPVNEQRSAAGQTTVTSLWLWGEAELALLSPPQTNIPWDEIYTDNPVISGLGLWLGVPVAAAPGNAAEFFERIPPAANVLCWTALTGGDQGRAEFNQDWALPLFKALQRGLFGTQPEPWMSTVKFLAINGSSYTLSAGKRRWWRHQYIDHFIK